MSSAVFEQLASPIVAQPVPGNLHRLLILRNGASELLVAGDRSPFTLPGVEIPRWERVAENLTAAVRKRYGISAICLFAPELSPTATDGKRRFYQVMETRHASARAPDGTNWLPLDSISDQSFTHQDRATIAEMLRQIEEFRRGEAFGPFGRPGWIDELFVWTQREIEPHGLRLTGEYRQLNASPTFALLRLETDRQAVWFKAVGEPNLREFPITLRLAQLFPTYVPRILATCPSCNGWLSLEIEGTQERGTGEIDFWETTAAALASLQIESIKQCKPLLDAGAHDLGFAKLAGLVHPFLDVANLLMDRQTKIPPPRLSHKELASLGKHIEDALHLIRNLSVADSLGHLDPNPGNIIISPLGCVFLDWAEAYVGHPFFTLGYLLEYFRRAVGKEKRLEKKLIDSYARGWKQAVSPAAIAESFAVVPLLAAFAYTTRCWLCGDQERFRQPETAAYLRALTRRMSQEANQWACRRHKCSG